jgi:hypothetical protein
VGGTELESIFALAGTDKGFVHHYGEIYEHLLAGFRDRPCKLLEIGVYHGASLRAWERYLSQAEIIGVDCDAACLAHRSARSEVLLGDVGDGEFLAVLAGRGPFGIVIDDGSHLPTHQQNCLTALWPAVQPGGVYVIEDLEVARTAPCGTGVSTTGWLLDRVWRESLSTGQPNDCFTVFSGNLVAMIKRAAGGETGMQVVYGTV